MNLFRLSSLFFVILTSVFTFAGDLPRPNNFGGNFTLPSTLARDASLSDWRGKIVLLNFGFTSCPDVCPMVLSKLVLVQNQLDKDNKKLQVIFVTVDPDRDSLDKMQAYLKNYHHAFVGMRGTEAEVNGILRRYGASAQKQQSVSGSSEFSHSDYVYSIDEEGDVAGFYDVKTDYRILLQAVKKLL